MINTFGGSLDGHPGPWRMRAALAPEGEEEARSPFDPDDLQGRLDAVIDLDGPRLSALPWTVRPARTSGWMAVTVTGCCRWSRWSPG